MTHERIKTTNDFFWRPKKNHLYSTFVVLFLFFFFFKSPLKSRKAFNSMEEKTNRPEELRLRGSWLCRWQEHWPSCSGMVPTVKKQKTNSTVNYPEKFELNDKMCWKHVFTQRWRGVRSRAADGEASTHCLRDVCRDGGSGGHLGEPHWTSVGAPHGARPMLIKTGLTSLDEDFFFFFRLHFHDVYICFPSMF